MTPDKIQEIKRAAPPSKEKIQAMAVCDTSAALSADAPEITMSDVGTLARHYLSLIARIEKLEKALDVGAKRFYAVSGLPPVFTVKKILQGWADAAALPPAPSAEKEPDNEG